MGFSLPFISPITAAIAAAIFIPSLVALYFLKLRRRKVAVASTLLWRRAVQDMQVNSPFQKMRRNLLLLIQLLLLIALLIAMARPTQNAMVEPGEQVVILIDHSASMNASDAGDTRLDEAKARALDLIDAIEAGAGDISAGGGAMVVSFAHRAQVLQPFTRDPTLLRAAIRSVEPTDQLSNFGAAVDLIDPFARQSEASSTQGLTVYAFTDGRIHLPDKGGLALGGADLRFEQVGSEAADNLAIVSLSARRDFEKPQKVQVFARVANYGPEPVRANLTLSLNGDAVRVQPVRVPAAGVVDADGADADAQPGEPGSQSVQFDIVLSESALIELRHDHTDALASDDAAWLTLAPARRLRVLLVTQGNAFIERVIRSAKVRELVLMTPDKFEDQDPELLRRGGWDAVGLSGSEGFDVIVFDGYSLEDVPSVDSLYLGGGPPIDGLEMTGPREGDAQNQVILDWRRDHPLLRYVVLDDVVLSQPGRVGLPIGGVVLATGQHGPVMAEMTDEAGVRHVVTSFNVLQSNWPLYISFPVFVSNSLQVLGLGNLAEEAGVGYRTGQVAVVPVDEATRRLSYDGPADLEGAVMRGRAVLPVFDRVGVYRTSASVEPPDDRLAVSLLDPVESDLRAAATLPVRTGTSEGVSAATSVRREVWHWFAWAALAVLLVEWLVYTRRMHI